MLVDIAVLAKAKTSNIFVIYLSLLESFLKVRFLTKRCLRKSLIFKNRPYMTFNDL